MSMCRKTNKQTDCGCSALTSEGAPRTCDAFSVCLPLGQRLDYDGECLRLIGAPTVPDGEYGLVVVQNGCITNVLPAPVYQYTPPACVPSADPCSDPESPPLRPDLCNLLTYDASGRLGAFLYARAGNGVSLSGCGTDLDPFIISIDASGDDNTTYISSGTPDVFRVAGEGTLANPFVLSHLNGALTPGTHNGFILDSYGHVVGIEQSTQGSITTIIEGPGISVSQAGTTATISLRPTQPVEGLVGGYYIETDLTGKVVRLDREITTVPATYDPMNYAFTVNEFGSITDIQPVTRGAGVMWTKIFDGNRSDTSIQFTTLQSGFFRMVYRGDLQATSADPTRGLIPLPNTYRVVVDGVLAQAFMVVNGGRIREVHTMSSALYAPGQHTITIESTNPDPDVVAFSDTGIIDVTLTVQGG